MAETCVLYKHTGFTEVVKVIDVSTSPGGRYGTTGTTTQPGGRSSPISPLSGGRWGTPVRLGQPGVRRPTNTRTPSSGGGRSGGNVNNNRSNRKLVNSVDKNGNRGSTLWETDSDGNLIRQVGPFIPNGGLGL